MHSREPEEERGVHKLARQSGGGHTDPAHFRAQILQLYVAAYQNPVIWKLVWKDLVGVISVQIVRDVEAFVTRYPFADADVMRFVVAS